MTEPLADTWNSREMPVLTFAAKYLEETTGPVGPTLRDIADGTGMDIPTVTKSVNALASAGLIEVQALQGYGSSRVDDISPQARQLVGLWPTPESALDRMIAALEAIAANTANDEDTRSLARRMADWLSTTGTQVGIGLATAALTGYLPH